MKIKTFTNLLFMIPIFSLSAQNRYSLDLDVKTEPTEEITINETGIGFTISWNMDQKIKVTNTLKYKNVGVNYQLENYTLQNNLNQFNSFSDTFGFSRQLTKKTKLNFEIEPIANFESNLNLSDVTLLGGLEISHTINASNRISIGVKRMTIFGKPQIDPTFSFYHQINEKASIEIGFPNAAISYSNNIRNKFSLINSFAGSYYNLDQSMVLGDLNTITKLSFSQITTALEYERNVDTNWFVNLKGGYGFNRSYNLTDNNGNTKIDFNIDNGYLFNIGIKYKH